MTPRSAEDEPQCRVVCPVDDCIVQNPDAVETKDHLMTKHKLLHG